MTKFETALQSLDKELRVAGEFRQWLRSRRWCGESLGYRAEVSVKDHATLADNEDEPLVWFLATAKEGNVTVPMSLMFQVTERAAGSDAFELPTADARLFVLEAERSEAFARFVSEGFLHQKTVRTKGDDTLSFHGAHRSRFRSMGPTMETDSSNLLVRFVTEEREVLFKSYKRLDVHNREPDLVARLHRKGFANVPRYIGEFTLGKGDDRVVLGIALEFLEATDLFSFLTARWGDTLLADDGSPTLEFEQASLRLAKELGEKIAEMHAALVDDHAGPFQRETFTSEDGETARKAALSNLSDALVRLAALAKDPATKTAERAAAARQMVFENRNRIEAVLDGIEGTVGTAKCVTHADLHLGQVLRTAEGKLLFIDFEGEPERMPGQRHVKLPPLRDVATLDRSFSYVVHYAWRAFTHGDASAALQLLTKASLSPRESSVAERLLAWGRATADQCSRTYLDRAPFYREMDPERAVSAIRGWMMEKALYELRYELKHRPENILIPLEGVISLSVSANRRPAS